MRLQHRHNRRGVSGQRSMQDAIDTIESSGPPNVDSWLDLFDRLLQLPAQHKLSIRDELRSHLTERIRDLMLTGTDRDVAMRQAINELGEAAELAERFRRANHYPRRRLLMNTLLAGVCTTIVIGAVAVMNTSGSGSNAAAPAFFAAQQDHDDQRATLDTIYINVTTDMSPRQIVDAIVATEKIGVFIDWAPLEEIGMRPDEPLGLSGKEIPVAMVMREMSRRLGPWDELDWRVNDRVLMIDTRHAWDLRERIIASYDIESIVNRLQNQYNTEYSDAIDQIRSVLINLVDPEQWVEMGGDIGQIEIVGGRMFVQAPLRMHEKVAWILNELSKSGSTPVWTTQPNEAGGGAAGPGAGGGAGGRGGSASGGAAGGGSGGAGNISRAEPNIMPNPTAADRAAHAFNQRAMAQMRNLHMAVQIWNQAKDGKAIDNIDQLVEGGILTKDALHSPSGPAADGKDYWIDFASIINPGEGVDWSKRVCGIDRAMYATSDYVAVMFADGHIELLSLAQMHARLDDPSNVAVKPDLPKRH